MSKDEAALRLGLTPPRHRERPRPGPRPALSVAAIADAGVLIADAEGLRAVSMAKVAGRLA